MRFCLIVPEEFYTHFHQFPFEISGLLNWARVLGGEIRQINHGDLDQFDTIMTNVSSTESEYISIIRQVNPDAKIIACFDYGFDVVNQYFTNMERVKQVMERADIVFSVNRNQVEWMKVLLPEKIVHYIPHPTDIDNVVKFHRERKDRESGHIAAMWHQYDNYQIQSLEVLKTVERKLKRKLTKVLVGLKPRIMLERGIVVAAAGIPVIAENYPDEKLRGQPLDPDLPKIINRAPMGVAWDTVLPYLGVDGWYSGLSRFEIALDLYTTNSVGRFGMDCAGVGIPLVASDRQDSSKLLWPFTTVDPFVPMPAITFVSKLLSNAEFYERVEQTALRNLKHFGFPASKERMMRVLET